MTFVIACLITLTITGIVLILLSVENQGEEPVKRVLAQARNRQAWRGAAGRIDARIDAGR
jgi:hypothetical protein